MSVCRNKIVKRVRVRRVCMFFQGMFRILGEGLTSFCFHFKSKFLKRMADLQVEIWLCCHTLK